MTSDVSRIFERRALGRWLGSAFPSLVDYRLDRLVPRGSSFHLRIMVDVGQGPRAEQFELVPAAMAGGEGWPVGSWRLQRRDPLEDADLQVALALRRLAGARLHSYTPGRRAVLACVAADGAPLFGKLYRGGKSAAALRSAEALWRAGMPVAEPAGSVADLDLVLWRAVPGKLLGASYPGAAYREGLARAATALRRLHGAALPGDESSTLADEADAAREHLARVAALLGRRPRGLERLLESVESLAGEVGEHEARTLHGDFHDNQVMLTGARAVLLDLDRVRRGDPAVEVGNFLAHIDFRLAYVGAGDEAAPFAERFERAYGQVGGAEPARRVACGHALSLLRNCCLYVFVPARLRRLATACARVLRRAGVPRPS